MTAGLDRLQVEIPNGQVQKKETGTKVPRANHNVVNAEDGSDGSVGFDTHYT